jgi:site-specific recombinase XerD
MVFQKYHDLFENYLMQRKYSERTVQNYCQQVEMFLSFIEKYYPNLNQIDEIKKDIILDFQNYLVSSKDRNGKYLSNNTLILKLIALRKFFRFLKENDFILINPAACIVLPKEEKTLHRNIPTQEEMQVMIQSVKPNSPINMRNRAILEILYACGIRTTELCRLKISDIDFKQQTATVYNGKGGKSRIMPLTMYACEYTKMYLEGARKHLLKGQRTDPGNLFLSNRGNPFNRETINKCVMNSILKKAHIDKHFTCYSVRHATATHLLQNKVDITYISKLLGHASLKTTQVYTKIEISDLQKMHSLYHPREKDL